MLHRKISLCVATSRPPRMESRTEQLIFGVALPNWVAAAGIMEAALTDKFSEKVAELRKTDLNVGWNEIDKGQNEMRRIVKFSCKTTA
jgi:hypothetical protein